MLANSGPLLTFFASFEELRSLYPSIRGTNTTLNLYVAFLFRSSYLLARYYKTTPNQQTAVQSFMSALRRWHSSLLEAIVAKVTFRLVSFPLMVVAADTDRLRF
jgi:hypothetical protein